MKGKDFDWQTNEFMLYCRSTQLREKTWAAMRKPFICSVVGRRMN